VEELVCPLRGIGVLPPHPSADGKNAQKKK